MGKTAKIKTGCGTLRVTVNYKDDKPFETFFRMGRAGGCAAAFTEAVGRLASLALRNGAKIEEVETHLMALQCNKPVGVGDDCVSSCLDGAAKAIKACVGKEMKDAGK